MNHGSWKAMRTRLVLGAWRGGFVFYHSGMGDDAEIDLRGAVNAVSDVVQNRPRPLRVFDQIYMKTGDMVLQSELVARWADGKKLAFIGDGDAISVCVAYLHSRGIIGYGPSEKPSSWASPLQAFSKE